MIGELSAPERVQRLERSHAMLGLRELARAIDAKDPATREHSERVAALAVKLARAAGWSADRAVLLSDAALVHDVGKVAVSDALLHKVEPLTSDEREAVREHAELAARIAEGVLEPEQVEWIRTHHERPDGDGYPRGLAAHEIPEGAALLAIADAWDVMTSGRPYSAPRSVDDALDECAQLVGKQFTRDAVGALMKLHAGGELDVVDLGRRPRREPAARARLTLAGRTPAHYGGWTSSYATPPARSEHAPSASSRRSSGCPRRPATSRARRSRSRYAQRCCPQRPRSSGPPASTPGRRARPDRARGRHGRATDACCSVTSTR